MKKKAWILPAAILAMALICAGCGVVGNVEGNEKIFDIQDGVLIKYRGFGRDVVISDGVTRIENRAFGISTRLKSVIIPKSVRYIGEAAFGGPGSADSVDIIALADWSSLTNITVDEENVFFADIDGVLFTKDISKLVCYPAGKTISAYSIPKSVIIIGDAAFSGCTSLTNITIPESVKSIGAMAFSFCSSLTGITIPESVTSIGMGAFGACTSLTSITIPEGVTSIDDSAFHKCTSLTSITIPESVTSIGNLSFAGCTSLTSITIPESVTSIGYTAFYKCTSLASITIPKGVTSIEASLFANCTSLTSVTIPEGIRSIGYSAFAGCTSLASVTIPKSVTIIGDGAFVNCPKLTIYGTVGSEAERYAKENKIPFAAI